MQTQGALIAPQKHGIAVYAPEDYLEQCVQSAYHEFNNGWLSQYPCQLFARSIKFLKAYDDTWLDRPDLLPHRLKYFFSPSMAERTKHMVFATHLLFLRDIIENASINCVLHSPVIFSTKPIAHYLLREYSVHILLDGDLLQSQNEDLLQVGGLMISEDNDVDINGCVLKVIDHHPSITKLAVSEKNRGIFHIDEAQKSLFPGTMVWDKQERRRGFISMVEPGPTGMLTIEHDDKNNVTLPKHDFELRFTVI